MTQPNATAQLASFATATKYRDIPEDVRELAQTLLIDSIGCAVAGLRVEKGSIPTELAEEWAGASQATILGRGSMVPVPSACFANGELMNALDFDAILAPGHVTPYVIPPALSFAEQADASLEDLIAAVAIAHEVGCRVAAALDGMRRWGAAGDAESPLSPASGYGSTIFGAAAGGASVLGFDVTAMEHAFGIAGYAAPVPGLTKFVTAPNSFHVKYTSAGQLAQNAAVSLQLAERGYSGDRVVLDGDHGFWRMFASQTVDWDFMLGDLGSEWRMRRAEIKPYPAFRMSHDALGALRKVIAESELDPDAITRIVTTADPLCMSDCYLNDTVEDHTDAQLSWPHLLAAAAYYPEPVAWQMEGLRDPRVTNLAERIEVRAIGKVSDVEQALDSANHGGHAFPEWLKSTVTVEAGDKVFEQAAEPVTKGHPDNPMTADEVYGKYLTNVATVLGEAADASLDRLRQPSKYGIRDVLAVLRPEVVSSAA